MRRTLVLPVGIVLLHFVAAQSVVAQSVNEVDSRGSSDCARVEALAKQRSAAPSADLLTADQWIQVDAAVHRGLNFLAAEQHPNGSFPSMPNGQPGVTSFCVLAFVAHGHNPGEGTFGQGLERAVNYILSCQKQSGLIARSAPDGPRIIRDVAHKIGTVVVYNHAISSLTLSEIYGMGHAEHAPQLQRAIDRSLECTLEMQQWPKSRQHDHGGWRYLDDDGKKDSDLSVTGWQLMFLRSARNAGFNVPEKRIEDAIDYVRRSFDRSYGVFNYTINRNDGPSRGMAGAGILALGHAGFHNSLEAKRSGEWLLQYSFEIYNDNLGLNGDRYHYSLFTCCQGMYQLGSPYWERFFPRSVSTLLAHQDSNGSWDAESYHQDRPFGNSYTTALVLLSLGAPNQFLPIFQR